MSLQRSRTTQPRSARSSNSPESRETCRPARWVWIYGKRLIQNHQNCLCSDEALEPQKNRQPWKRLGASGTQPRGGGRSRPEMAPQRLEKIKSAPGNVGLGSLGPTTSGMAADRARLGQPSLENDEIPVWEVAEKAPNALKSLDAKLKSAPALGIFAPASGGQASLMDMSRGCPQVETNNRAKKIDASQSLAVSGRRARAGRCDSSATPDPALEREPRGSEPRRTPSAGFG